MRTGRLIRPLFVLLLFIFISGCIEEEEDKGDLQDDKGPYGGDGDEGENDGLDLPEGIEVKVTVSGSKDNESDPLVVYCYLADTHDERRKGLMGVEGLREDLGMLFVYDPPKEVSFWMKDTNISLDIVFIGPDLNVSSYVEAEPGAGVPVHELETYDSVVDVGWVLEVNQGLMEDHGLGPGASVEIEELDSPDI